MGASIVIVTLNSQRQASALRARLGRLDVESFGIADQFKEEFRELNDSLRRYRTGHAQASRDEFIKASHELGTWINAQVPMLRTQHERELLRQIEVAYEDYIQLATNTPELTTTPGSPAEASAAAAPLHEQSRHLIDLDQALARAHYESRNQLLEQTNRIFAKLRLSVLSLLGLLFICGVALAIGVYRHMIDPLRVKLVENQALMERQEKLASLGMLAAGVAHEIRNPLTAIKAALFIHRKEFQPGTREHSGAQLMEREILRLERILNHFLQFARPAEPELATIPADVPLQEVQGLLAPQLAKADIELVREDSSPVSIRADAGQIKQVLVNLVQNAADSIGQHGTIALRARPARQHLTNGEIEVTILEVADSGKGIPPDVEKRLFDPFFTTKEQGTGLGLCIAAQIVKRHGGALQYQTQVNHGTTFGIVLPTA